MPEKDLPSVVYQRKRPKDGSDYSWSPLHENPYKPQLVTGWRRIGAGEPPAFFPGQFEEQQPPLPGLSDEQNPTKP